MYIYALLDTLPYRLRITIIRIFQFLFFFFFSSRRRHTRFDCDWSSDVCSSDLDVIGGQVQVGIDGITGLAPHVRSGRLRLLAVTNRARVPLWPDTPTAGEVVDRKSVV